MKGKSLTFRPRKDLRERLEFLAKTTERPISYFLEKAIEQHLPSLEERYAREIEEYNQKHPQIAAALERTGHLRKYPSHHGSHSSMNEPRKKTG